MDHFSLKLSAYKNKKIEVGQKLRYTSFNIPTLAMEDILSLNCIPDRPNMKLYFLPFLSNYQVSISKFRQKVPLHSLVIINLDEQLCGSDYSSPYKY